MRLIVSLIVCAVLLESAVTVEVNKFHELSSEYEADPSWNSHPKERVKRESDLPIDSIPLRYDLFLNNPGEESQGCVKIHIRIVEATQKITLNYEKLKIDNVDLVDLKNNLTSTNLQFEYVERLELLTISLPRLMNENDEIVLDIKYKSVTFSDYHSKDEHSRFITARNKMPCYDEPAYQAVIALEIQHNKNFSAISNMPIVSREEVAGSDDVTSKFQDTPPMPTYLFDFFVSNFTFISNENTKIEQRIYFNPHLTDKVEVEEALKKAGPIMRKLEEIFEIEYPLTKLDHVAGLSFQSVNLHRGLNFESFGLIFHENWTDQRLAHHSPKVEVAINIARQYFQLIFAPNWWLNFWMIDGLAVLYGNHVMNLLFPDKELEKEFEKRILREIRQIDEFIFMPEETSKRASLVLPMFQDALTVPTFTKGLKSFFKSAQFALTDDDFYRELQTAYDDDFPGNGIDIGETMKTWKYYKRYPTIYVQKKGNNIKLTQNGRTILTIPIRYRTKSGTSLFWLKTKSAEIQCDNFMVLNINQFGSYLVNYDDTYKLSIVEQFKDDASLIPDDFKLKLLNDIKGLTNDVASNLYILSYLEKVNDPNVWKNVVLTFKQVTKELSESSIFPQYQKFLKFLIKPHFDRLGFEQVDKKEPQTDSSLRNSLLEIAGAVNYDDYLIFKLQELVDNFENLEATCDNLKLANASIHSQVVEKMLTFQGNKRYNLYNALTCSLDHHSLDNFLQQTLDRNNSLTNDDRKNIIFFTMGSSDVGLEAVYDLIGENYKALDNLFSTKRTDHDDESYDERLTKTDKFRKILRSAGWFNNDTIELFVEKILKPYKISSKTLEEAEIFLSRY